MIKDREMGQKILESIGTLNEAAYELYAMFSNDSGQIGDFVKTMQTLILGLKGKMIKLVIEEPVLKTNLLLDNALNTLSKLNTEDTTLNLKLIKNELIPEIGEAYVDLLFWGGCYPDSDAMFEYYNNQMKEFYPAPETDKGRYRYDLSVAVMANTDREQTERCLESVMKAVPTDLRCEYILFNDGQGDAVADYFEDLASQKNVKVVNYRNRTNSPSVIYQLVEGKNVLFLTSENEISETAVENMLRCLNSDRKIGAVCPVFVEEDKLESVTGNEYLWRQKSELNTDVVISRSADILMPTMLGAYFPLISKRYTEFSSKAMSLIGRRNGKLLYEAGDALACRLPREKDQDIELEGVKQFEKIMGINPLLDQDVDEYLLSGLDFSGKDKRVDILGIDSSFGVNLLTIQDRVREQSHNLRTNIYSLTEQKTYARDLEAIARKAKVVSNWDREFDKCFPNARFDYIVREKISDDLLDLMFLLKLLERLKDGGALAIHTADEMPLSDYEPRKVVGDWQILYK